MISDQLLPSQTASLDGALTSYLEPINKYYLILLALMLPFLLYYTYQFCQSILPDPENGATAKPKHHPYMLPVVGNTISFIFDTQNFLFRLLNSYGHRPVRLSVALDNMLLIPPGELVGELFRRSKELSSKTILIRAVRDCFGTPEEDVKVIFDDDSGILPDPMPGHEFMPEHMRVQYLVHRDLHNLLGGASLDDMTARFIHRYTTLLKKDERFKNREWVEFDDLYTGFMQPQMFRAAIEALCGNKLLELVPDFPENFWKYDYCMPDLLKGIPRWLVPGSYAARDRVLDNIVKWQKHANDNFDWDDEEQVEAVWEPLFGAKIVRARQRMFKNSGQSARGAAGQDLGVIWAQNANAIPAANWMLMEIFRRPGLLARVQAEISNAFDSPDSTATMPDLSAFDVAKLCSGPLMTSIYMEVLRLTVSVAFARNPNEPGFVLGKRWNVPTDTLMFGVSLLGQLDEKFWGTWNNGQGHKAREFWPERFLIYHGSKKHSKEEAAKDSRRTTDDDKKAKVTASGIQNHWTPYGGGIKMCPGRFFAKNEMLAAVSVVLKGFEIEFMDLRALEKAKPDPRFFAFGTMPPDRKVPVRIRRR